MSKHNDGGPAFPLGEYVVINGVPATQPTNGLSLRDYFAAAALQTEWMGDYSVIEQTRLAYEVADAMLAQRAKRKEAQP